MAAGRTNSIEWLAGLLEGEGCFGAYRTGARTGRPSADKKYARISLGMTDKDVMERASAILGKPVLGPYYRGPKRRDVYRITLNGDEALAWMLRLFPHMGERRQASIVAAGGAV